MSKKHEDIQHERMFYCFVDLRMDHLDTQTVYVVPSQIVAEVVRESHRAWLSSPGRNGHVRKDSSMRRFLPDYSRYFGLTGEYGVGWLNQYREAWHLLTDEAGETVP